MNVLEKMNELVGSEATKDEVINWAYSNRIYVVCIHLDEPKFEALESTVEKFLESEQYSGDEHESWDKFLDFEFVEQPESKDDLKS